MCVRFTSEEGSVSPAVTVSATEPLPSLAVSGALSKAVGLSSTGTRTSSNASWRRVGGGHRLRSSLKVTRLRSSRPVAPSRASAPETWSLPFTGPETSGVPASKARASGAMSAPSRSSEALMGMSPLRRLMLARMSRRRRPPGSTRASPRISRSAPPTPATVALMSWIRTSPRLSPSRFTWTTAFVRLMRETMTPPAAVAPGIPGTARGAVFAGIAAPASVETFHLPACLHQLDLRLVERDARQLDPERQERPQAHAHCHLAHPQHRAWCRSAGRRRSRDRGA